MSGPIVEGAILGHSCEVGEGLVIVQVQTGYPKRIVDRL
jgi:hypothetical protein